MLLTRRHCFQALAIFTGLSTLTLTSNGQCASPVSLPSSQVVCPQSPWNIGINNTDTAFKYTFAIDGKPIPSLTKHPGAPPNLQLSYVVDSFSPTDQGIYTVTTYDTCGNTFQSNSFYVYYGGMTTVDVNVLQDTGASFVWNSVPTATNYFYAVLTDTSTANIVFQSTTDTTIRVPGLTDSTAYYFYVYPNVNCFADGTADYLVDTLYFKTAIGPCQENLKQSPILATSNPSFAICPNGNITLSSGFTTGVQWYKDSIRISGATGANYNTTDSGNYLFYFKDDAGCYAFSNQQPVILAPIPSPPNISASSALTICSGDSVTLTSSTIFGNQWYISTGAQSIDTSQNLVVYAAGTYTVQHIDSNGCSATSVPEPVTINSPPPIPVISPLAPLNLCSGSSLILRSSASSGNQWMNANGPVSGETSDSLVVTGAGSYTVVDTGSTGCTAISIPSVVRLVSALTPPTISPDGPFTICTTDSVVLASSAGSSYQWYRNGTALLKANGPSYAANDAGSYSVAISSGACQATSSQVVTINTVQPPITPSISIVGTHTTLCGGDTVDLMSTAESNNVWYLNNNIVASANGVVYPITSPGDYSVSDSIPNVPHCSALSTIIHISSGSGGDAIITYSNGVLNSDSSSGNQWFRNDTLITGANGATFTPTQSGDYTLQVNSDGCLSNFSTPYAVTFRVLSSAPPPNVVIFPNPAVDDIYIDNVLSGPILVVLYDMQGRRILVRQSVVGTIDIDCRDLQKGAYIFVVTDIATNNIVRYTILKM